jgi:hypothetical protein
MVLLTSLLLALVPFLGFVWILLRGSLTTVDGLFTSLILLAISAVFGGNALFELRHRGAAAGQAVSARAGQSRSAAGLAGLVQRGKVKSVLFFESNVGQSNKSIVVLGNGSGSPQTLVFDGDMRNALPAGQKVEITFRKSNGHNVLVNVSYS